MYNLVKRRSYFEGWYFKHQSKDQILALIPGIHIKNRITQAFIQVITNDNSYFISYPITECYINRLKSYIKIGETVFSQKGVKIHIHTEDIKLDGIIRYGKFDPIKYTIMGFFKLIPFMECKHEIISMHHILKGEVILNNKRLDFRQGIGYIEKDWGHSFPLSYQWLHCNYFYKQNCSVIVSVAHIPFAGRSFKGCICVIHYGGKEYRLTTYLGVKVIQCTKDMICLKQGKYLLKILIYGDGEIEVNECDSSSNKRNSFSHKLYAPKLGDMSRTIFEQHFCKSRFIFYKDGSVIFDLISNDASLEIVE
jgi:tocopherol cyclase